MISKRRRHQSTLLHEHEVQSLMDKFINKDNTGIRDDGTHVMLKWLVHCSATEPVPHAGIMHAIEECNATGTIPTPTALINLQARATHWLVHNKIEAAYIEYMAFFFHSCRVLNAMRSKNSVTNVTGTLNTQSSWLNWTHIRRSLVIPDIRKLALELQWQRELRPGEREFVQRISNNTTASVYGTLQSLRTPEYVTNIQSHIMYGSVEDIKKMGLLDVITLAIIQTRMNNRSGMDWIKRCVHFMCNVIAPKPDPVPHIIMENKRVSVVVKQHTIVCNDVATAYACWCKYAPKIIDGRYDVSECTI